MSSCQGFADAGLVLLGLLRLRGGDSSRRNDSVNEATLAKLPSMYQVLWFANFG